MERATGIEPALSAWESVPSEPVTWPDLRGGICASDRERPVFAGVNGTLMARRTAVWSVLMAAPWSLPSSSIAPIPRLTTQGRTVGYCVVAAGPWVSDPAAPFGGVMQPGLGREGLLGDTRYSRQSDCDFRSTLAGCWGNRALAATGVQASGVCWRAC